MRALAMLLAVAPLAASAEAAPKAAKSSKAAKPSKAVKPSKAAKPSKTAGATKPAKSAAGQPAAASTGKSATASTGKPATPSADKPATASTGKPATPAAPTKPDPLGSCTAELTARQIAWKPASRPGIAHAVEITGPLGGVSHASSSGPLVIDCSLAISLDEAGRYLRNLGIDAATYSSAYSRRMVRGTNRPSKHSYGLAIDVSSFSGPDLGTLHVDRDYEQGLGDAVDCLGRPLTVGGATLKLLQCQLARSGLFYLVLSPDFDDAHHDHFHLEVKPWAERAAVRAPTSAVH